MILRHWIAAGLLMATSFTATVAHAVLPIQHWTAASGARVYFVPSPSIPMLDISVDLDAGSRYEPSAKAGLASMTVGLLDKGVTAYDGAPARSEGVLADALADIGAQLGGSASGDRASVRLRTLSSAAERDAAVGLMAQLLSVPSYPDAIIEREKERLTAAIRESETRPGAIAGKAFGAATYQGHPYGFTPTVDSVQSVKRDDLVAFQQRYYAASRAVVTLIGAIDRSQAERIADQLTRGLPKGAAPAEVPAVRPLSQAREIRIPHPAQQAHVLVGQPGIARDNPDFFPILVGNYIFGGGGFTSRLTTEVREKRGLTYGVSSYFSPAKQPGPFQISVQTKKEQAGEALRVVRNELARFVESGPTAAELKAAKSNLVNGFPLRLDSNRKLLDNVANIAWYGLPLDYLDTWTKRVEAVTASQVREAFHRALQPDRMVTVIVGAAE